LFTFVWIFYPMPSRRTTETIAPEALLDESPPPIRDLGQRLRDVVMEAVPDAIERVRPGWRLIGYDLPLRRRPVFFAWIWPEVEHVHLGFPLGTLMDDPERLMKGAGITKQARWLTYEPGDDVDTRLATELVREAARVAELPRPARLELAAEGRLRLNADE
jgi:hypothetical protein